MRFVASPSVPSRVKVPKFVAGFASSTRASATGLNVSGGGYMAAPAVPEPAKPRSASAAQPSAMQDRSADARRLGRRLRVATSCSPLRFRREPSKQLEVEPGKDIVVRQRGDLGESGQGRVAPARRRRSEPRQAVLKEAAEQLRKPARAVERVRDAPTPVPGTEHRVSRNAPADRRPPVEEERVHQGEADEVAHRLAGALAALPVDDPGNSAALHEHVAEPEVTVDGRARNGVSAQPRVDVAEAIQIVA